MVNPADPNELLALALQAAVAAGDRLVRGQREELRVESKSSPTDVVTHMDRESEELVRSILLGARPDDGILGEEGADDASGSGVRWIVDPIDGTVNYLYGLPAWAVSIGVELDGQVVAGVVHAPAMGETFTAVLGGGAMVHDSMGASALRVRDCESLGSALVATGFGYVAERRRAQASVVAALLPEVRDIRRIGACALDLCWVAAGRLDAYFERGVQPWDHAAGGLIAREAGAWVGGLAGRPEGSELIICSTPAISVDLRERLAGLNADQG